MSENDELIEPLEQGMQHAMSIAGQIGREVGRMWQQRLEQTARMNEREAARVRVAFDAERGTARATLAVTERPEWLASATPREVVDAYRVAVAWQEFDPAARDAAERLRTGASERWGVDAGRLGREHSSHTDAALNVDPKRLEDAHTWAQETGWVDTIPAYYPEATHVRNLLADYDLSRAENERGRAHDAGDEAAAKAAFESAAAAEDEQRAVRTELDGPTAADESWYQENVLGDPATAPAAAEVQDRAAALYASADGHTAAAGDARSTVRFEDSREDRATALAERMRAAGAPEQGIKARMFGESQQGQSVAQAAASGVAKTTSPRTATQKQGQKQAPTQTRNR